jgi:PAS domain S-box-containing protein
MISEAEDVNDYRICVLPPTRRDGEVTRALFERAGLKCAVCERPGALAAQIERGLGAIVLTDAALRIPSLNIVLAALAHQPSWSDVPTILLSRSAAWSPAIRRMLGALANVTVLDRPASMRTLLSSVQSAIRGRQRQYQIRDQLRALREAEATARENERRFRSMANTVPQLAWMADATGSRFWYNDRWYEYTGTSAAAMQGWGWRDVVHPQQADHVVQTLRRSFETGSPWEDTYPMRGKDGTFRWFLSRAQPIEDEDGRIERWVGTDTDMTDRLAIEEALRQADRRKDEFLATLAHELRNPLAPIRQAARVSNTPGATETEKRWCHAVIDRQVEHMSLLLDDLLDISRVTRGTLALRIQPTDLRSIISVAVETARPLIDAKSHTLSVEAANDATRFFADPLRVAQVLSNLLTNAAKYTDAHGTIRLSAGYQDGRVEIRVADTGIGISAQALPNLFHMFSQIQSTMDRSEGGLGIGLALAKGLIELHGGSIEAHSAGPGHGSEFVIRVPCVALIESGGPDVNGADELMPIAPQRVLIADDNRDAAESLGMLLRMDGHEVIVTHDGPAALSAFRDFHPDIVILDIGMPGQNGYEVARLMRETTGDKPFKLIAVTGWGQDNDREKALNAGFDSHLTKPVDPERLTKLMQDDARSRH